MMPQGSDRTDGIHRKYSGFDLFFDAPNRWRSQKLLKTISNLYWSTFSAKNYQNYWKNTYGKRTD